MALPMLAAGVVTQVATVVIPVAGYFLVLGLLNTRKTPQLLTGQMDFALLMAALGPGFIFPVLVRSGLSSVVSLLIASAVVVALWFIGRSKKHWVIYNISDELAREIIAQAFAESAITGRWQGDSYELEGSDAVVRTSGFPMLRNVSVRMEGGDEKLAGQFQVNLEASLAATQTEPQPMAVALLMVATLMLIVPLGMLAPDVPEIVRLVADFWR